MTLPSFKSTHVEIQNVEIWDKNDLGCFIVRATAEDGRRWIDENSKTHDEAQQIVDDVRLLRSINIVHWDRAPAVKGSDGWFDEIREAAKYDEPYGYDLSSIPREKVPADLKHLLSR